MANGEKTQAFILSVVDAIGGSLQDRLTGKVEEAKTTAKQLLIIEQTQRVIMLVVVVGAIWWFTKKKG